MEFAFKRANGPAKNYPVAGDFIEMHCVAPESSREPLITNVIHRGMIEAQTRLESLAMARSLTSYGLNVLAVYADAVIVERGALPLLPPPWRLQAHLTNLQFFDATHFTSDEMERLPGIPRAVDERRRRLAQIRGL
jgi:hypothetical protein